MGSAEDRCYTVSSASSTCFNVVSAVECTATVLNAELAALRGKTECDLAAIGDQHFVGSIVVCRALLFFFDDEQRLAELDRVAVLDDTLTTRP